MIKVEKKKKSKQLYCIYSIPCLGLHPGDDTPAPPHCNSKTWEATVYWWKDFKGPSLQGTDHRQEGIRATSSLLQGCLQKWHQNNGHISYQELGRRCQQSLMMDTGIISKAGVRKKEAETCCQGEACSKERKQHGYVSHALVAIKTVILVWACTAITDTMPTSAAKV